MTKISVCEFHVCWFKNKKDRRRVHSRKRNHNWSCRRSPSSSVRARRCEQTPTGKTAQRATVWRGEHLDSRRHCAILIESHSLSAALGCETSEIWTHRNNGLLEHWIIISLNVCWIADRSFHRSAVSAAEVDKCCVCMCGRSAIRTWACLQPCRGVSVKQECCGVAVAPCPVWSPLCCVVSPTRRFTWVRICYLHARCHSGLARSVQVWPVCSLDLKCFSDNGYQRGKNHR